MATLVLTITIPNIEEKYGHPIGESALPPVEEIVSAIQDADGPEHINWLMEATFSVSAEYV